MKKRIVAFVTVPLLLVASLLVASNAAAGAPERFRWHVSNGFIQTGTEIPQTGAVAQADNGDFVRVTGRGKFDSSTGTASGGGAFAHTDSDGDLVGFGTWKATGDSDFVFFGCGTAADGTEVPPNFCGGDLTLDVRLKGTSVTEGTATFDGVLVVTCLIGDTAEDIPADAEEGITLDIPGLINFDDLVPGEGGLTLFLSRD